MYTKLTLHAANRSRTRGISLTAIGVVLEFGKHRAIRGADIYILGWREIRLYQQAGLDLSKWEGIEVVCAHDGSILTVYRNKKHHAFRDRAPCKRAA
jgi:hypothetical protein